MQNVTQDRDKYIGGSDIPIIMGLSPFKSRFQLLQEKAGLAEPFEGNKYTEYGHIMEPKIRDYINQRLGWNFKEDKKVDGYMRYHADGYSEEERTVLEIKTTSQIHETLYEYKAYLVQLLTGIDLFGAIDGVLVVYERPEDFSEEFDPRRVHMFHVRRKDHEELLTSIKAQAAQFWADLQLVKENPLITEEELQPMELVDLSTKILALEERLQEYKAIEEEEKSLKAALKEAMTRYGVKKWTTYSGVQITLVPDGEDTVKKVLDEKALKKEEPEMYKKYLTDKVVKGRSGYVKITLPK